MSYILSIDQSTSGTKAILFDGAGVITARKDLPHRQIISEDGWVSHDPMEIYRNAIETVKGVVEQAGIDKSAIAGVGITNQRETALVWNRDTGLPVMDAVVWQCARGKSVSGRLAEHGERIRQGTGLPLSPYFSAAKIAWILERTHASPKSLCAGTIDSWLVFKLTGGEVFATDYSNASRTQLLDIRRLEWDAEICALFGIDPVLLPQLRDSDGFYGETDFEGYLDKPVPIHSVLGDSHASLLGHGCLRPGMAKATYGTGSSVMMNIGTSPVFSGKGLATSLAWRMGGKTDYVLEGNIHYSCAVIKWLVEDVKLLSSAKEAGILAAEANPLDSAYLVPAFTGLGAPHWKPEARAVLCGMSRTTGRAEIVRAAEECVAYQIADVVEAMGEDSGVPLSELRVDGGAAGDRFLVQFQSDILGIGVTAASNGELSAYGAAVAAGRALGVYSPGSPETGSHDVFTPKMDSDTRERKRGGWRNAINMAVGEA